MVSTQVKINIAETEDQGALVVSPEIASELGVKNGDKVTLEIVAGTLVIRGESGLARAKGAGAPWRRIPPLTSEEEEEALARAIGEAGAQYE